MTKLFGITIESISDVNHKTAITWVLQWTWQGYIVFFPNTTAKEEMLFSDS